MIERFVVHNMAVGDRLDEFRIFAVFQAHERHHSVFFLAIRLRLSQNRDVPVITDALEKPERDRIRDTAVKQFLSVDIDDRRNERHRCGRSDPIKSVIAVSRIFVIDRFSRFDICAYGIKFHGVFFIRFEIERIVFERNFAVAEICIVNITCFQQRADAAIPFIRTKPSVIPHDAPDLMRLVIATESSSRGNSHSAVENHSVFHHDIYNSGGKKTSHRAAFKDQPFFHTVTSDSNFLPHILYPEKVSVSTANLCHFGIIR